MTKLAILRTGETVELAALSGLTCDLLFDETQCQRRFVLVGVGGGTLVYREVSRPEWHQVHFGGLFVAFVLGVALAAILAGG